MRKQILSKLAVTALCCLLSAPGFAQVARNPGSRLPSNFQATKQQEYNTLQIQEVTFPQFYDAEVVKFYHEDALRLNNNLRYRPIPVISKPTMCGNGDFEKGIDPNEWEGGYGYVDYSGNIQYGNFAVGIAGGPINDSASHHTPVGTGTDPNVPISTTAPTGSTQSVRLGNAVNYWGAELLAKTFVVPSSGTILNFWYALVLQDPGHAPNEQPAFRVRVLDASGNPITGLVDLGNGSDIAVSDINNPFFQADATKTIAYKDWSCASINLTKYGGQQVTIQFVTNDCALGGHYGYAYIDDFCGSCSNNPYNLALGSTTCEKTEICLKYTLPTQGSLVGTVDIDLNIYQNGTLLTTLNSGVLNSGSDYCFGFSAPSLPGFDPTAGGFDYTAVGHFTIGSVTLSPFYLFSPPDGAVPGINNDCVTQKQCCPGRNLIVNGGFEAGNTGFSSAFTYQPTAAPNSVMPGYYGILTDAQALTVASTWKPDCAAYGHHLIVNGATGQAGNRVAWQQRIPVTPGLTYKFCGDFKMLQACAFEDKRGINVSIVGGSLSDVFTKSIPFTTGTCNWTSVERTFVVPAGVNSITISISPLETLPGDGNDIAMDNFTLVQLNPVPSSQTMFGLNPYNVTSTSYNVSANASVALPAGCTHYWEVAEVDPNAGYAVIGSTQVIDPASWRPLATNTFIGYVGTNALSGTAPGLFDLRKTYRFVYGRSCTCESITKRFLIYGPLGNKPAAGQSSDPRPHILGSGVLNEQTTQSATGISPAVQTTSFSIFPNPTDNKVTIQKSATDADYDVKVFNAFGQLVKTVHLKAADTKVELSLAELASGNYMVHVVSVKGVIIHSEKVTRL